MPNSQDEAQQELRSALEHAGRDAKWLASTTGKSYLWVWRHLANPLMHASDGERLHVLQRYVDRGHVDQITVGQDLSCKHDLMTFGGGGYPHIVTNVIPMMRVLGFSETDIAAITVANPRNFLTIK